MAHLALDPDSSDDTLGGSIFLKHPRAVQLSICVAPVSGLPILMERPLLTAPSGLEGLASVAGVFNCPPTFEEAVSDAPSPLAILVMADESPCAILRS